MKTILRATRTEEHDRRRERGQGAIEYALILLLVAMLAVTSVAVIGRVIPPGLDPVGNKFGNPPGTSDTGGTTGT